MFEISDLGSRTIAREYDLFVTIEKCIESVKKFLLRSLFSAEKLDIINQKQVGLAVALTEFHQGIVLNSVDKFVDEQLARQIHHLRRFLFHPDILADGLHQVRLAQTNAAINKERIVSTRGRLGHRQTRGVRDLIVRADHE